MLNDLWPEDIQADDEVLSPLEILESQAHYLSQNTNGLLTGAVESHEAGDRRILAFEVYSTALDSQVRLFEVHQSLELDYPAAIVLPNHDLPGFLKKERYVPAPLTTSLDVSSKKGRWIENEWVTTSPQEFSEKIAEALDHPSIKGRVLSLISRSQAAIRQKKAQNEQAASDEDTATSDGSD